MSVLVYVFDDRSRPSRPLCGQPSPPGYVLLVLLYICVHIYIILYSVAYTTAADPWLSSGRGRAKGTLPDMFWENL